MDFLWRLICPVGSSVSSSNDSSWRSSADSLGSSSERSSNNSQEILPKSPLEIPAVGPPAITHDQHREIRPRAPKELLLGGPPEIPRVALNFRSLPNILHVPSVTSF